MSFEEAARRYCELIESAPASRSFPALALRALSRLYAEGVRLPDVGSETDATVPPMPQSQWEALFATLRSVVGEDRPVLADALADVYRDLSEGFALARAGASPLDVLDAWRTSFATHWGRHALDAMRELHELVAESVE